IAQVVQSQLADIGVTMEIAPVQSTEATVEFRSNKRDAYLHVINGESDPSLTVVNNLLGVYNLATGPKAAELEELLAKGTDPGLGDEDRNVGFQDVTKLAGEQTWYIPICHQPTMFLFPGDVVGDAPSP